MQIRNKSTTVLYCSHNTNKLKEDKIYTGSEDMLKVSKINAARQIAQADVLS